MANTKKVAVEDSTNKKEENTTSIDVEAIINKAVVETAKKYESKLAENENEIRELKAQIEANQNMNVPKFDPNRRVKLMHMGAGSANFNNGRIHVDFKKLFDTVSVRYDIFEDFFDTYRDWFTNFEIVILDKDVRENCGIEYEYEEKGADKDAFYKMLKMNSADMLKKLNNFSYVVAMGFLKFFINEYLKNNVDTLTKFEDIQTFYESRYNISDLRDAAQEVLHQSKQ